MPLLKEESSNKQERTERIADYAERSQHRRERILATYNENTLIGLEQIFEAKIAAVKNYEQQLATISDPYARKALLTMLRQERQQALRLVELMDLIEQNPDAGKVGQLGRKINHQVKMNTGRGVAFWLSALAVGVMIFPSLKESLQPIGEKTMRGIVDVSERIQGLFSGMREDVEDLISEAQFEKLREKLDFPLQDDHNQLIGPNSEEPK